MDPDEPRTDQPIRYCRSAQAAERLAFVLAAVGIRSAIVPGDGRVELRVAAAEADAAEAQLAAYEHENRSDEGRMVGSRPAPYALESAFAWTTVLVAVFAMARRRAFGFDWISDGLADAGLIVSGEVWRAVTALTLHADGEHLLGNIVFGMVFGVLLAQLTGAGVAWLAIVAAGIAGNVVNALLQDSAHSALGASTAVFGALGAMAAYAQRSGLRGWRTGLRRWSPVAAGIMLLAWIGFSGERTDIGAHVAGFVAGVGIGGALAQVGAGTLHSTRVQLWCGAIAIATIGLGWLAALPI